MALTKVTSTGIADDSVTSAKIASTTVATADIACSAVTSAKINDGTITASDLNSTLDLSSKTVTLPGAATSEVDQNIALLGFKMAVNEGLTVFNLVDGVVDEFHDESGTDEGEGSNDLYCASCDFYKNQTSPVALSGGFTMSARTESDTSVAMTNPTYGAGTFGTYTVPSCVSSVDIQVWGAGGGGGPANVGGGGGYAEGTLAVTASQVLYVSAGEGGANHTGLTIDDEAFTGGGKYKAGSGHGGSGGGLAGVFSVNLPQLNTGPEAYVVAGSGGGAATTGGRNPGEPATSACSPQFCSGGAGGGLTGDAGGKGQEQTGTGEPSASQGGGGGGDQEQGGQGACQPYTPGALFEGGDNASSSGQTGGGATPHGMGTGGAGFYGGGGGNADADGGGKGGAGGGGSSYYGHPQITSGSTEEGGDNESGQTSGGGGTPAPNYQPGTNEGGASPNGAGEDGYVLISGSTPGSTSSTNIVSNAFTASSAPSTARIVVFQEDLTGTPSGNLNTDIIASISRDGGSNFTTATLADSGYVTGTSGQRILTGTATVSGQPSGTAMRWKLALANNASKIHGVSLQWK